MTNVEVYGLYIKSTPSSVKFFVEALMEELKISVAETKKFEYQDKSKIKLLSRISDYQDCDAKHRTAYSSKECSCTNRRRPTQT